MPGHSHDQQAINRYTFALNGAQSIFSCYVLYHDPVARSKTEAFDHERIQVHVGQEWFITRTCTGSFRDAFTGFWNDCRLRSPPRIFTAVKSLLEVAPLWFWCAMCLMTAGWYWRWYQWLLTTQFYLVIGVSYVEVLSISVSLATLHHVAPWDICSLTRMQTYICASISTLISHNDIVW